MRFVSRFAAGLAAAAMTVSSVGAQEMTTATPVTRAMFVNEVTLAIYPPEAFLDCYKDLSPMRDFTLLFKDVTREASYGPGLCLGMMGGFVDGYSNATFLPDTEIDLAEASKIIVKAFGIKTQPMPGKQWWAPYVTALAQNGGINKTITDVRDDVTWADMMSMISALATDTNGNDHWTAEEVAKWMK